MQIKSWQIGLAAVVVSFLSLVFWFGSTERFFRGAENSDNFYILLSVTILLITSTCALLLKFDKTKKLGAVLSIFFSLPVFMSFLIAENGLFIGQENYPKFSEILLMILTSGGPQGLLLLAVGVHYFWKEEKIDNKSN